MPWRKRRGYATAPRYGSTIRQHATETHYGWWPVMCATEG